MTHTMLNCQEASQIVSESLDRKLPFRKRVGLWIHLSMCRLCSRFRRDFLRIRGAVEEASQDPENDALLPNASLSVEARDRMKRAVKKHQQNFD